MIGVVARMIQSNQVLSGWCPAKDPKPDHQVFPSELYGFDKHNSHLT